MGNSVLTGFEVSSSAEKPKSLVVRELNRLAWLAPTFIDEILLWTRQDESSGLVAIISATADHRLVFPLTASIFILLHIVFRSCRASEFMVIVTTTGVCGVA